VGAGIEGVDVICPGEADSDDFVAPVGGLDAVETFGLQLLRRNVMRIEKGRRKRTRIRDILEWFVTFPHPTLCDVCIQSLLRGEEIFILLPLEIGPGMRMVYS